MFSFQGETQKDLNLATEVMRKIHSLITNYQDLLKKTDYQQIATCLQYLGFNNLIGTSEHTKVTWMNVFMQISEYFVFPSGL